MSCLSTTALSQTPCHVGGLDFAGGGPVHMASGAAGLAFCIILGNRKNFGQEEFRAHSVSNVFLGTALLWFGWFGFNGGSALSATPRAGMAAMVTILSSASGAITWIALEARHSGKMSGIALCSGALAGLVGITPGCGYVTPWAALVTGIITSICCYYGVKIKTAVGFDDALDAFGLHGVGGFVGSVLTGFFASKKMAAMDGGVIQGGGFIDGEWHLLGYNIAGSVAISAYSFIVSYVILYVINKIPYLHLRVSEHDEMLGGDMAEMGEIGFPFIVGADGKRHQVNPKTGSVSPLPH
jgi:Amt family ammonium transporter